MCVRTPKWVPWPLLVRLTLLLSVPSLQCNNDYVPVCGSNGDTYQNECYLKQAACKQQSEILLVSEGSCATGTYNSLQAACPPCHAPQENGLWMAEAI